MAACERKITFVELIYPRLTPHSYRPNLNVVSKVRAIPLYAGLFLPQLF